MGESDAHRRAPQVLNSEVSRLSGRTRIKRALQSWGVPIGFGIALAISLSVPMPFHGRLAVALLNLCHAPFFCVLAYLVFRVVGNRVAAPKLLAKLFLGILLIAFGLAMEGIQSLVGRQPSGQDAWANAGGVLAGALFYTQRATRPSLRVIAILGGVLVLAWATHEPSMTVFDAIRTRLEMPMIASFERRQEVARWDHASSKIARVADHRTHGEYSLRVDFYPARYPGVSIEPAPNWTGFQYLRLEVYLAADRPFDLTIKIFDAEHNGDIDDRFNRTLLLRPGANFVEIPLEEVSNAPIERQMDLRRIRSLSIFAVSLEEPRTLYFDNIRLE